MLRLEKVNKKDYKFLYELLKERDPIANISHQKMPSWDEHVKFNNSRPYKHDFVIKNGKSKLGRVYVTSRNEIGIFIKNIFRSKGYGTAVLGMILDKLKNETVYANIAPYNKKSQNYFKKFGFRLIQYTYRYKKAQG